MKINFYQKTTLIISFIGAFFSVYLNTTKFSVLNCAIDNTCLYFMGYSVYWYSLVLFVVIFLMTALSIFEILSVKRVVKIEIFLSLIGMFLFGYIGLLQILGVMNVVDTLLGIPLFVYSLVLYLFIFISALSYLNSKKSINLGKIYQQ